MSSEHDIDNDLVESAETVTLTIPGIGAYLGIVRTTTAGIAARQRFPLDAIEDLRIAVDEACNLLLGEEATAITCTFVCERGGIDVELSVPRGGTEQHWQDTFAWQLLSSLADDVSVRDGADTLAIRLQKKPG
jgi:serine/threonine-protein kinase RsbW